MEYNPRNIELKWQKYWKENNTYKVSNESDKPKFYVLDMFPYPSGAGLHVGHPLGYIASDIYSRFKRLQGFNVLHPMGYDAFGLPAEQYAIQTGVHPEISTNENIEQFRKQLDNIGFSYDWSREIKTCDPEYYKWTQWIFSQLYLHYYDNNAQKARPIDELISAFEKNGTHGIHAACGEIKNFSAEEWNNFSYEAKDDILTNYRLVYRKMGFVNWCEELGTVLANDEVVDGVSERGGFPVTKRPMVQWSLRTTAYAERLLQGLQNVNWSDALKTQQLNWIGKSEGAQVFFQIKNSEKSFEIFTTRPDTIFGSTFAVLAPEHALISEIVTEDKRQEILDYLEYVKSRSDLERKSDVKRITGTFTGAYAINPFSGKEIPIWTSEYVLADYGSGAIMAVPSNDERDNAFAQHFNLEIIPVIDQSDYPNASIEDKIGTLINSDFLNGLSVNDAIAKILEEIEAKGIGKRRINYKLRDANFSRQRYWGEPFPVYYDNKGIAHLLPSNELPVELPAIADFKPKNGESPLKQAIEWVNFSDGYHRETDTMPGFAGSSWYFLRYMDPNNSSALASNEALNYWQDVDLYIGGAEHAVGHLLYSRMWHKFLFDIDVVPTDEPFKRLVNQGMIQGVSEKLYLYKEIPNQLSIPIENSWQNLDLPNGATHLFVSEELTNNYGGSEDMERFSALHTHIEFVSDYGLPEPYLNQEGIKAFTDWRKDYADAVFLTKNGYYFRDQFTPFGNETSGQFYTLTEVEKMSKSKYNVINPDDVINDYGADCFRMYEMFLGPLEQAKPWDTKGIDGVAKFLRRLWSMYYDTNGQWLPNDTPAQKESLKALHQCIKKLTGDIEKFSFNTTISALMICVNELKKTKETSLEVLNPLVRLVAPFAPHLAEELWSKIETDSKTVLDSSFPILDENHLVEDSIVYPIAVNGKRKYELEFPADASANDIENVVKAHPNIEKWTGGASIKKMIIVPKKMINIVVG